MAVLFKNVRTRLTLWYVVALSIILLIYAGVSIGLVFISLRRNLDNQLEKDYEIIEDYIQISPNGTVNIDAEDDPYFYERWFDIWSPEGKLIYASRPFTEKSLPPVSLKGEQEYGFRFRSLELSNRVRIRIMSGTINIDGHWLYIRLLHDEKDLWRELNDFFWLMIIALPLAILAAGLGGYFLAKKFLAPVERMAEKARKIGEENLQERLPVGNADDELGNLAKVFNELLERLQKSFERLKQFTSDAAHELRTPLTAIRSIGEVGLQERKTSDQYREIIGSILEENHRLTHLVDNLLFLSRADARSLSIHEESVDLDVLVRQTIELIQPLAEEKNQQIQISGTHIQITADGTLLKQALLNLLDNAIKYSPENARIDVNYLPENLYSVRIDVIDQGNGISREHQKKIFERFYRVDKGRSRDLGGSGLGLAIALWAIQMQGGSISVDSRPHEGSKFTIRLPLKRK